MKVLLIISCLAAVAISADLADVLKSPLATVNLYKKFKSQQHLKYGGSEDKERFQLFRQNAKFVAGANANPEDEAEYDLNEFSAMTPAEKKLHMGINATMGREDQLSHPPPPPQSHRVAVPAEKIWIYDGGVTAVKNQGDCGSCWAFSAVAAIETHYWKVTGKLRAFSDQEILDCGHPDDGCKGGWPEEGFKWSQRSNHLAAERDYPYQNRDTPCNRNARNSLIGARITGTVYAKTERENIQVVGTKGTLSVAFEVTDYTFQYKRGIMRDNSCTKKAEGIQINHGVAMVGYTSRYALIKNSWGEKWGDRGYGKFSRNHHGCGLYAHSHYPVMQSTGQRDNGGTDRASNWKDDNNNNIAPTEDPNCKNKFVNCDDFKDSCHDWAKKDCPQTCGQCGNSECASGTIRCPDGVCRHEHMCHGRHG